MDHSGTRTLKAMLSEVDDRKIEVTLRPGEPGLDWRRVKLNQTIEITIELKPRSIPQDTIAHIKNKCSHREAIGAWVLGDHDASLTTEWQHGFMAHRTSAAYCLGLADALGLKLRAYEGDDGLSRFELTMPKGKNDD